jgi:hypothetical protein
MSSKEPDHINDIIKGAEMAARFFYTVIFVAALVALAVFIF